MFDEDAPEEPDEVDPVERWGTPEEDLPNVPTPPAPEVAEGDVDPELLGLWWRSVALANVALGGVAVGLMVIGFRRMWGPGVAAIVLGLLAGLRLYQHYRVVQRRKDEDGDATGDEATEVDATGGDATTGETERDATAVRTPPGDDAGREPDAGRNA